MAKVRVESKCEIYDGMSITFKAPCDCTAVDGLNVYHNGVAQSFSFRDAHGNDLAGLDNLFSSGTYVKVVLDTTNNYAYLQNADTNAYLEEILADKLDANMGPANAGLYLKVGADGSLVYANPVAKFSQGPVLITESQTLDLSQYGLRAGDQINVVCIGGGGAGGSDAYALGGAGGKGGESKSWTDGYYSYYGKGGGGGGGGYGGGGGGATGHDFITHGGGGGGSGYLTAKTITLTETKVAVTIGAAGQPVSNGNGGNGGPTSFGSYLSASGGSGGERYSSGYNTMSGGKGGAGGHNGGNGYGTYNSSSGTASAGYGGGGGGGWVVESFTIYSGSAGVNATANGGGNGGTNGGAGSATSTTNGQDSTTGFGHGCVVFCIRLVCI